MSKSRVCTFFTRECSPNSTTSRLFFSPNTCGATKVNVTDCKRGRYYSLGFPFFALDEVFGENSEWIQTEISEDYRIYGAPAAGFDAQEYDAWCRE